MQQIPQDSTLLYRIEALERLFHDLQQQLQQYVRSSENNLHLQAIRDTCERIERELGLAKQQLTKSNEEMSREFAGLREEQNRLQIRTLAWIVGSIATFISLVLVGVLTAYVTHLIH